MKTLAFFSLTVLGVLALVAQSPQPAVQPAPPQKKALPPPIQPTAEDKRQVQAKVDEIDKLLRALKGRRVDADLLADVEIYASAGRLLLEFPEDFFTQDGIHHALAVLDTGIERARQLQNGHSPWTTMGRRRIHGFVSAIDGSVQPYGVTLPESHDASKPSRLYVWMHGRQARTTESEFLFAFPNQVPARPPVADNGQIELAVYGRWNAGGWHFAGEADVWEAIAAVEKRYKIDSSRILLRGFSMGGEGAWHIALHHPDRFAAVEIGAGTWSRRADVPGLTPYQRATIRIWENMHEWALNAFNLPLAAHDGDTDTQIASLPGPLPGVPTRGQLESSLKAREQMVKEGFALEGDEYDYQVKGTPSIFLISKNTGHGTSPEVRLKLDAFLKLHGDRGIVSPDRIRFLTYTTRYNRSFWTTLDELDKHYERAEIDAQRLESGRRYEISTKNTARLTLREMNRAAEIRIDGQTLRVKGAPEVVLEKSASGWRPAAGKRNGLHKVHGLQGPIDDAFLDPYLLVRPTGTPWNAAVHQQVLRTLARFDRLSAKYFRGHPRIADDRDVTEADFSKYHVVLFGDPGSNRWIARLNGKLPVQWTRDTLTLGREQFAAGDHFPALIYPSPVSRSHYVVLNSGLTIADREFNGDYGLPRLGDFAVLKVKEGADVGDTVTAGLFDEEWQLPPPPPPVAGFDTRGDIGVTPKAGSIEYDAAKGEIRITGGGANIWAAEDAFHFLSRRINGDATLTADIRFLGQGAVGHRKAVLMFRQELTPDSAYADVAVHGDGLTSLQYRETKGGITKEIRSPVTGPTRVSIQRVGNQFTIDVSKPDGSASSSGPQTVILTGPVYIGLGVCSHDANVLETAVFSNVRLEPRLAQQSQQRYRSKITVYDLAARSNTTVYQADQVIEAPNWSRDGKFLLVNTGGSLYRLPLNGASEPKLEKIDLGEGGYRANNDHDYSRDGKLLAFSASVQGGRGSQVFLANGDGTGAKLLTPTAPSYFHGWSPDSRWLAFVGQRNGKFELYRVPAAGGPEERLTSKGGYDDGPEYSPDGKWIYFNSNRDGGWDIFRMPAGGGGTGDSKVEKITNDEWEDWFPHLSPNGKRMLVFAFPKGTGNHNGKMEGVVLRIMPVPGKTVRPARLDVLTKFFGGQGTINVNSWSPDSKKFAYVVYEPLPPATAAR